MGAFLSQPITDKETIIGEGNGLRFGMSEMQGWRTEMEDAHIATDSFSISGASFFGVFDGHGGKQMSKDAACLDSGVLAEFLKRDLVKAGDLEPYKLGEELKKAFVSFDERRKPDYLESQDRSGCTATTVLITKTHIICANSGDSRTVMCNNGGAIPLSQDHKPQNDIEKKRIENAGGSVMMNRVNGDLAVSRALGDFGYKANADMIPEKQMVSPEPDIHIVERSPLDDFVILACDGVWDVMKNQEAVDFVKNNLLLYPDLGYLAEAMLDHCLGLNSRDNMTVLIVAFSRCPSVPEEQREVMKKVLEEKKKEQKAAAALSAQHNK